MPGRKPIVRRVASFWVMGSATFGVWLAQPERSVYGQMPPRPKEAADTSKPSLFVAERFLELGTIVEGETPTLTWTLENRGGAAVEIERTAPSCGCTIVSMTDEQKHIQPGGTVALTASFDSRGRRGESTKTLTVFSNDPVEPELKLDFHVVVAALYNIKPPGLINLRMVRRGETTEKTVDFLPAEGHTKLEIQDVITDELSPLRFDYESIEESGVHGQRIRFSIAEDVPLGTLRARADVHFNVDGITREHGVMIHGEVVGDLVWRPIVVDMTRHPVTPGRQCPPVVIESTGKTPIEIISADAGPLFDVSVDRSKPIRQPVKLTLRSDAPAGPFATTLRIRTSSLDQPVVAVPVFGIVANIVEIDPPLILLRDDGTKVGTHRRVSIRASDPGQPVRPKRITCDHPGVAATVDDDEPISHRHMFLLDVVLRGKASDGPSEAMLTIETDNAQIGDIHIPVMLSAGR